MRTLWEAVSLVKGGTGGRTFESVDNFIHLGSRVCVCFIDIIVSLRRNQLARSLGHRVEQQGFCLGASDRRLGKAFDPLERQGHIATVLFPAARENLPRLVGACLHRSTGGRQTGADDKPLA